MMGARRREDAKRVDRGGGGRGGGGAADGGAADEVLRGREKRNEATGAKAMAASRPLPSRTGGRTDWPGCRPAATISFQPPGGRGD